MSLRIRLLITIATTLVALSVGMYLFASRLIFRDFSNLEQTNALDSLGSAKQGLSLFADGIYSKAGDWSTWDDTYQFMQDRSEKYIQSNLGPSTLPTLNVDVIAFVTPDNKLFYSSVDPHSVGNHSRFAANLIDEIDVTHLQELNHGASGTKGIVCLSEGPILVAIRPILTSNETGPSRGWIVFGRFLQGDEITTLRNVTGLQMDVTSLDKRTSRMGIQTLVRVSKALNGDYVDRSPKEIAAHTIIRDLKGDPALVLTVHKSRAIYRQGIAGIEYFILSAVLLCAAVFYVLERFALSRLSRLTEDVENIQSDSGARRVKVSGHDELSFLGTRINQLLAQIQDNEVQLQRQNEGLELTVQERTREIEHQAFHDPLTGLANRTQFLYRVEHALNEMKKGRDAVAIIFLDLDNFKLVNDSLGHSAGDQMLRAVSERLKDACRSGDTVARLGGDEFTVLMENVVSIEDAVSTGQRILNNLLVPLQIGSRETFTSASVGLVYTKDESITSDALLKNADTAMYYAKANGKSHVAVWEERMNEAATEKLELATDLRRSLEGQEIFIDYQPLVNLSNGTIVGAEALARWRHPRKGVIAPDTFIPLAEESGMMIPIGYWILEEACRQALKWQTEFNMNTFAISVNISGLQLLADDVVESIAVILAKTGLSPSSLELEITESVLMSNRADVVDKLIRLRQFGIKLALDDFGTGYSSLARLSSLPVDTLKIDRAFISRLEESEDAVDVVKTIMSLSRTMKLEVTGEGIETHRQMEILHELGCTTGQGYYFSKPLSRGDFAAIMSHKSLGQNEPVSDFLRAA